MFIKLQCEWDESTEEWEEEKLSFKDLILDATRITAILEDCKPNRVNVYIDDGCCWLVKGTVEQIKEQCLKVIQENQNIEV